MGAIGDYIHYTTYGYAMYGNSPPGGELDTISGDAERIKMFDNYRRSVKQRVSTNSLLTKEEKSDIENVLSAFIGQSRNQNVQFWNWASQKFQADFDETLPFVFAQGLDIEGKLKKANRGVTRTTSGMIESRIRDIQNIINSLNPSQDQFAIQKLIDAKNLIMKSIVEIVDSGQQILLESGYENPELEALFKKILQEKRSFTEQTRNKVLNAIDYAAMLVQGLANAKKGQLFEAAASYALAKALGIGYQLIEKTIEQLKVGNDKTSIVIDSSKFSEAVNLKQILGSGYEEKINQHLFISALQSKNKVDIKLDFHGKQLLGNLKNLNFKNPYDISLTSEAQILQILQRIDADFVNHFLNTVAAHGKSPSKNSGMNWMNWQVRNAAKLAMYSQIVVYALMGSKIGGDKTSLSQSNVFIVNNNKAGNGKKVYVFNISDILGAALDNIEWAVTITPDFAQGLIPNKWLGENRPNIEVGRGRASNILAYLHSLKLSVALDKNWFRSIINFDFSN